MSDRSNRDWTREKPTPIATQAELDDLHNKETGSSWDKCLSPESKNGQHCPSCVGENTGLCHYEGCEFLW